MADNQDVLLHILELKGSLSRIEQKVDTAVKSIEGNGQPGLMQRVGSLEQDRAKVFGVVAAASLAFEAVVHKLFKW